MTEIFMDPPTGPPKRPRNGLQVVPESTAVEHVPVCSIDGEPWPCAHAQQQARFEFIRRCRVLCRACGKVRTQGGYLSIEEGFDGQAVYFHDRKACRPAAVAWWDEHVRPLLGRGFLAGEVITNLIQYCAVRDWHGMQGREWEP